jgi:thymidine kinase
LAKLYFRFAAMNAGKSTSLLQVAHNYEERGQSADIYTAALDDRAGVGRVSSRLGVTREANTFRDGTDFAAIYRDKPLPSCILIDEAQFLSEAQVTQLH